MHKICGFYINYFSIELKRGSCKTIVLPLTKRQGVFFQSLTAAFNCYNLQYLLLQFFLSIMLGYFFFLTMTRKPTRLTHINATIIRHDVLHPSKRVSQPLIGCVLISHATLLAPKSKDFYYRTFNHGSVRSVGKACDCRGGGRGFVSFPGPDQYSGS